MSADYGRVPLEDYDTAWGNTEAPERGEYAEVPDGEYVAIVTGLRPTLSREKSLPMFSWEFTIRGPQYAHRKLFRNDLITPDRLKYIKADFITCGLDLDRLSDFYDRGMDAIGVGVVIKKVTKKGKDGKMYPNVYIQKRIDLDDLPEDDIPF